MLTRPIRLVVTDVDGCLGPGEAQPYDLEVMASLAECNRRARCGESVPAITLCTGRPAAYVDAMQQVIGGFLPAIFENGAGLYFPLQYRFAWHPALPPSTRTAIQRARELIEARVVETGIGYIQPGKERALTLLPMPGCSLPQVGQAAKAALAGHDLAYVVQVSVSSVDIWPEGIDKGDGAKWLSEETGIALSQMLGVGDAVCDLCFMRLTGFSAAPANAEAEVRASVDYVSPYEFGRGLIDIIERMSRLA